ncbi:MAG: hypothetical protein IKB80_00360 [Oscillospiraceae bacterium]|nr:hypothetical protein [Oscillospiraceae bacterium]
MKRLMLILLAVLLLAGCGKKKTGPQPTESDPNIPPPVTLYIPGSNVEKKTDGAVRLYGLEDDSYFGISNMGSHLLVMGNKGLTVLTGEDGQVRATLQTDAVLAGTVKDIAPTGVAYYQPTSRVVTVLNPQLQVAGKMELPKEIVGDPCISIVKNEVFYSTGSELRALNMTTGISRLLRQQTASTQTLLGAYFDGTVLLCRITDADGDVSTEYISAETGQTLAHGREDTALLTVGDRYIAQWQEGVLQQTAFGVRGEAPQSLQILPPAAETKDGRAVIPGANRVVDHVMTETGLELICYDLNSGKRIGRTVLPGVRAPIAFSGDGSDIYMLATDTEKTCHALYRWNVAKSGTGEETVYTGPLYTAENPDTEGLAQSRALADTYQTQYGVKLLLWQDAVKVTGGHTLTPEYHPQIINGMLEKIKPVLEQFPEKFLLKTVEAGWIRIALVRDIAGDADWAQFWDGKDCWVILSAESDIASCLLQGIAYGVDAHVLGNSREFDTWAELNPKGFDYTYSAHVVGNTNYLTEGKRAFADLQSMTYPNEDRCRIFYYACLPQRAELFSSPVMQAKLLRLCKGIREGYNLQKRTETFAWEQYLETSLAYVPET